MTPADARAAAATDPVLAAGAVVWKLVDGRVRVLLVHRTQHKDITIPKGKVDPGETLPETAVREIEEETGFSVDLGAPLGAVEYVLPNGRPKIVHYWSAEVDPGAAERHVYEANGEILGLEWVPLSKAAKRLSYEHDADVLDRFAAQVDAGHARTFALVVLRHGKAMPPEQWDGPDHTRPLLHRGIEQSISVARGIAAYGPEKLVSSTAARCLSTIAPTAAVTGLDVKASTTLSQDAYDAGATKIDAAVAKRVARRQSLVLCSHGPVIPQIIEAAASVGGAATTTGLRRSANLGTGDYTVLHFALESETPWLVAVETHESPI